MEYFLGLPENQQILRKVEDEISQIKSSDHSKIAQHLKLCKKYLADLKFVENEITIKLKQKILSFGVSNNVNLISFLNSIFNLFINFKF